MTNKSYFYGFCWWIPTTVGNEIEGDSVKFDLKFYAEQRRHNPNPENRHPFANNGNGNSGNGGNDNGRGNGN